MESAKKVIDIDTLVNENVKLKEIRTFSIDNIEISWMTNAQKKFFEFLKNKENRNKK